MNENIDIMNLSKVCHQQIDFFNEDSEEMDVHRVINMEIEVNDEVVDVIWTMADQDYENLEVVIYKEHLVNDKYGDKNEKEIIQLCKQAIKKLDLMYDLIKAQDYAVWCK